MEPREPYKNLNSSNDLELMGATIRLGMTPLITARTSTADGHVTNKQVLKAFVLLKTDR